MPIPSAMGEPGVGSGPNLQSELAAGREAAASALEFFAHVAPLAQRLGMTDFPEFSVFEGRFSQTDDLRTAQLRADGVAVQQLHTTVASAVEVQKQQESVLADGWPDGQGIAAQQQLRSIIPRGEADLAEIAAIGAGMLVAADCIDVARLTQYSCIAVIDPDNLLGVPIALWLKMTAACCAHHAELRAAIAAAVDLFGTAVGTCDEAIDAILSGLCTAMAAIDSADYPVAVTGSAGEFRQLADRSADRKGDGDSPGGGGVQPGGSEQLGRGPVHTDRGQREGSGARAGSSVPGGTPSSTPTISGSVDGAPVAPGTSPVVGGSAFSGQAASELLGPLLGVVGTVAAAAVTGVAEAITTVIASGGADGPATSITLGEQVIDIKAGPDGASVSLTVTGAGGDTVTHVLDVRPDGSIAAPEAPAGVGGAMDESGATEPGKAIDQDGSMPQPAPDADRAPAAAGQPPGPPAASEPQTSSVPQALPPATALPIPDSTPHPPRGGDTSPNRGTPVSPQSSQPGDEALPQEDGQLALAGDQ